MGAIMTMENKEIVQVVDPTVNQALNKVMGLVLSSNRLHVNRYINKEIQICDSLDTDIYVSEDNVVHFEFAKEDLNFEVNESDIKKIITEVDPFMNSSVMTLKNGDSVIIYTFDTNY